VQLDALRVARGTIFVSSARQSPRAEGANAQGGRRAPGSAGMPRGRGPRSCHGKDCGRPRSHCIRVSVCFLRVRGGMTAAGMGVCVHGFCCVVHARVSRDIAAYRTVGPLLARQGLQGRLLAGYSATYVAGLLFQARMNCVNSELCCVTILRRPFGRISQLPLRVIP
jgi:hypothetical protein